LSVAAAFDLSYADLAAGPRRLFRRLGLVPGPSFDGYAAAALDGTGLGQAGRHLGELYDQHLITEPAPGRYQLHDLLREHARALAGAGDPAESGAAADRLLDYYLHAVLAAGRHIPAWVTAYRRRPDVCWPGDAPDLSTLGRAAAWLEAERPNLDAAVGYAAGSGRHLHAMQIPAAMSGFLVARGHWDQASALYQTGRRPARPGPSAPRARRDGNVDRGLHHRRCQPGPGGRALRPDWRPGRPGLRLVPAGHHATLGRPLRRHRQP